VKLLLDANLSPRLTDLLKKQGVESVHVRERSLQDADDDSIFDFAAEGDYVLVSEDTDFGEILAHRNANRPSVILLRSGEPLTPDEQAAILVANLPAVADDVEAGSIVVFGRARIRVRRLPFASPD
jgi:predicted nuclease of predicted toxin-antitoxin system